MSKHLRAICSGCRSIRTLRSDGTVRHHEVWRQNSGGRSYRDACEGAGKTPVPSPTLADHSKV